MACSRVPKLILSQLLPTIQATAVCCTVNIHLHGTQSECFTALHHSYLFTDYNNIEICVQCRTQILPRCFLLSLVAQI